MCDHSEAGNNIVLIGFMGAGKSTVGHEIERRAGYRLVDLDALIVECCGRSIPEIFACEGEAAFRGRETEALRSLATACRTVVATGGGVVGKAENWALMRRIGPVIYLRCRWETLRGRIGAASGRPLADGGDWERVENLYRSRLPLYEQADFIVDGDGSEPAVVAKAILNLLRKREGECSKR